MTPSDLTRLEPGTWKRFVLFLIVVVGILLCFSVFVAGPAGNPVSSRQVSD